MVNSLHYLDYKNVHVYFTFATEQDINILTYGYNKEDVKTFGLHSSYEGQPNSC